MPVLLVDMKRILTRRNTTKFRKSSCCINRVEVKTYSVAAGLTFLNWDNAFQGQILNRIFVAMVDNASFTGRYEKNPYNFKHFNTSSIAVYVNSGESLPARPVTLKTESNAEETFAIFANSPRNILFS